MSSTRASDTNLTDLNRIIAEARWLADNIDTLHVLSYSQRHQPVESLAAHAVHTTGPDLSEKLHPQLRTKLADAGTKLKHAATTLTTLRVALEPFLDDQAYDPSLIGSLLDADELEQARRAKRRRDAKQGDMRWGEYEFGTDKQPGRNFK